MDEFNTNRFSELKNAILQTAAYADVFDYPLNSAEIHRYLTGVRTSREAVEQVLEDGSVLQARDGFYTLPNRAGLTQVRGRREKIAEQMWPQAIRYGRLIARLPFVRMLAVTGSLAMNNVDRDPDIDYFIVTARGRLWTVRAMVLGVARAAAGQGVRLCPNYLVTEDALVFPDQTLYTAHELAQMVPIFGLDVYERICRQNPWQERFLPNAQGLPPMLDQMRMPAPQTAPMRVFERMLQTRPGAWFERWEMNRKIRRLSREQSESLESCFSADYCKGHNLQHGRRSEQIFRERLAGLHLEGARG